MLSRFLTPLPRPELKASNESRHHLKSRKASSLPLHCQPPCVLPMAALSATYPRKALPESAALITHPLKNLQDLSTSPENKAQILRLSKSDPKLHLWHVLPTKPKIATALYFPLVFLLPIIHFLPLLPPHPYTLLSFQPESFIHEKVVSNSPTRRNLPVSGFPSPFFFFSMTFLQPHADLSGLQVNVTSLPYPP